MTLLEFEAWISENYKALCAVAKRVTAVRSVNSGELLHGLIEKLLEKGTIPDHPDLLAWFGSALRMDSWDEQDRYARERTRMEKFSGSLATLGPEDTFMDPTKLRAAGQARRHKLKKQGRASSVHTLEVTAATEMGPENLFYGQAGDARWRYQQRRDARLFDGLALRSLGAHIRGRSSRSLHGAGRSLVFWGVEARGARPWGEEVAGYIGSTSWTTVSSSTGYSYKARRFGMGSPHQFQRCQGCSEHAISGRHDKACARKVVMS
jgi:hypothetical protein